MNPEIGHFALVLAFAVALFQGVLPLWGVYRGHRGLMALGRSLSYGQFFFMALAIACLGAAFLQNDFTVQYVARNSNTLLPFWYKISAIWGGHEGSLLLWGFVLSVWTAAVALFSRSIPEPMIARVLAIMGWIGVGFYSFMLFTSNPFLRNLPDFPAEGADLNPLLQDVGLILHPPMLYMGYVGFSVAFAFAIAGLLSGRMDSAWARWSRPWTTVAWCFLTGGIALGSWWAYYELGWGGWWFWDPVENASFMPWLVGTALIHSLAATEKRGVFKPWTVLLAILAFSLSLLGTFLVRSGVLTSVHAFASDPARGYYILVFLVAVIGGSLTLFAARANVFDTESRYETFSREMFLLINNILLMVAAGYVLLGTLAPIFADVLGLGKISIGEPFFNTVAGPLAALLMLLTGVGPLLNWKRHSVSALLRLLMVAFVGSAIAGVVLVWLLAQEMAPYVVLATAFCVYAAVLLVVDCGRKMRTAKAGLWAGWQRLPRSYRGMLVAHAGFIVSMLGITWVSAFDVEKDVRLAPGESVVVQDYRYAFDEVRDIQGPNYVSTEGAFTVYKGDRVVARLTPEKRRYLAQGSVMTEAAIDGGLWRDLYVALGEPLGDGSWAVRIYYKPLMRWVWGGGLIMALGGLIALSDRRYRVASRRALAGERAVGGTTSGAVA
ncbi:Cytochrome c-type biogenesis protein [gamma proteobacterium HdN1]|nr:Cytochrome c-type biogenesis protein [gamma proteobacterium HdN1]